MRRVVLLLAAVGVVFVGVVGSAQAASTVSLCVPSGEGAAITTPTGGSCGSGTTVLLPSEPAEQKKLISILPHINYEETGIGGKPTIQFSGVNLQVIDGTGSESTLNGTGNLILGYNEKPGAQTGSHNLLLGGTDNSYASYGGIVGGHNDNISGPYASILGGGLNTASGYASTITGGYFNKTTTSYATISGGCSNLAGTGTLAVNSACTNIILTGYFPSVTGGTGNQASAERLIGNGWQSRQSHLPCIDGPRWVGGSDRSGIWGHAVGGGARSGSGGGLCTARHGAGRRSAGGNASACGLAGLTL